MSELSDHEDGQRTRLCHQCGSEIPDKRLVLFCDRHCCTVYGWDHDEIPEEPLYKTEAPA